MRSICGITLSFLRDYTIILNIYMSYYQVNIILRAKKTFFKMRDYTIICGITLSF